MCNFIPDIILYFNSVIHDYYRPIIGKSFILLSRNTRCSAVLKQPIKIWFAESASDNNS